LPAIKAHLFRRWLSLSGFSDQEIDGWAIGFRAQDAAGFNEMTK
jgi:hypothetical protein